jgi:hypothetical protein
LGGECAQGECQPVKLGDGKAEGLSLAVNADYVVWTAGFSVNRAPIAGGDTTVLVTSQQVPHSVAVDAASVFWTEKNKKLADDNTGRVRSIPIGGGAPTDIVSSQNQAGAIVVDDTSVFWSATVTLMRASKNGTSAKAVAAESAFAGIRSDATTIYWSDDTGSLWAVPKAGGTPVELVSSITGLRGVAASESDVYFMETATGTLNRVPKQGGKREVLAQQQGSYPVSLVVDATHIYWNDMGNAGKQDGLIYRIPVAGSTPQIVARNQSSPFAIRDDAKAIYWLNREGGVVMKLAK